MVLSMFIAVETGDLVHSTDMSQAKYTQAIMLLKAELNKQSETLQTSFEIFRGDAFQVLYKHPTDAMRASLMTKLWLLFAIDGSPIEITQAIAFGHQDISSQRISENMGNVFIASGRLLDQVKRRHIAISHWQNQNAIDLIQSYLNHHLTGLTQKQAEVLYYYLQENFPEQQLIADILDITRQNVAAHLKRGGADLLKQTIEFFANASEDATK